jgi:hypothetical protein
MITGSGCEEFVGAVMILIGGIILGYHLRKHMEKLKKC